MLESAESPFFKLSSMVMKMAGEQRKMPVPVALYGSPSSATATIIPSWTSTFVTSSASTGLPSRPFWSTDSTTSPSASGSLAMLLMMASSKT